MKIILFSQDYFIVTINGKEFHKVENKDPRTFQNVKVFAGNNFFPAADVTYRNLVWENIGLEEETEEEEEEENEEQIEQEEGILNI